MENSVLQLQHIKKTYPGVVALDDVSFDVARGEIHALIGENGAGKSTLIKTCSGAVIPDFGRIVVNGNSFSSMTPQLAMQNGIAIIYQEFNLVGELSVAENVFLGRPVRKGIFIDNEVMEEETRKVFQILNIEIDPKTLVKDLTVGYQQMVEIAKAIQQDARILIMDEPSAPLTGAEVESMFRVILQLKEAGVAIVYISHRLNEIFEISDRITILRDGHYIKTVPTKETSADELVMYMVGRALTETYPSRSVIKNQEVVFEMQNVSGNGDKNLSFQVHKGEVLGLGGLIGAGRTEAAEMIFGAAPIQSGKMLLNGREIHPRSPREAIDLGIALVPEDRKRQGALLGIDIKSNINMAIYQSISKASLIDTKTETKTAEKYKEELHIKTPSLHQLVKNLSGGNQQKVVLGRWLAANAEFLIFDEPTRGIDVGAKYEIYMLMNELLRQGKTILLISSEMEELMGMSDRIIVMSEGSITGELSKEEFDQERIMNYASRVGEGVG